jgi:hypothetical protein
MKKILSINLIFVFIFSLVATPALAQGGVLKEKIRNSSTAANIKERAQERQDANMEKLKERAEKEINRRIESLNKLISRINEFKKLSSSQKASLTLEVQTEITSLTTLLAKIKADTDIETLKADVKSIVSSYRIYALFMPQIQILGAADRILNTADQMSSHAARLETKINEQQAKGQDVTDAQALLVDMKAKIANAKTQAQGAIDAVLPLTPEGYPGNKTTLQSARQMITAAIRDLNAARQDGRKIIVWLLTLNKTTTPTIATTP